MNMDLRRLRYFVVLAEELHFGRAAERLGIAQPPLSQQIQRFERDLETPLFERNRRIVHLTAAGRALLPEARDILARAERAGMAARRAGAGETGRLSIGFVGSATLSILPEILRRYRAVYPDVTLDLREMSTSEQIDAITSRVIEIGFARTSGVAPPLEAISIVQEPLIVALPDNLGEAVPDPMSLSALVDAPFIMSPQGLGSEFHKTVTALCGRAGFEPRIVQEAVQMQTIVGLVAAGIGVAIVPASLERFRRDGVTYRRIESSEACSDLSVVRRIDDVSPAARNFAELAVDVGTSAR